jgi:hypothetical protein
MPDGSQLGIATVHTVANLKAVATLPTPSRHQYYLTEISGVVAWEPSSSETNDDALVIQPTDRAGKGGRWIKVAAA